MLKVARDVAGSPLSRPRSRASSPTRSAHAQLGGWFLDWADPHLDDAARAHLGRVAGRALRDFAPPVGSSGSPTGAPSALRRGLGLRSTARRSRRRSPPAPRRRVVATARAPAASQIPREDLAAVRRDVTSHAVRRSARGRADHGRARGPAVERRSRARHRARRRGNRAAFTTIYERFHRVVHAIALARVRGGDAGDVVQDVFAEVWLQDDDAARARPRSPAGSSRIARRRAIDHVASAGAPTVSPIDRQPPTSRSSRRRAPRRSRRSTRSARSPRPIARP